jgi:hypothetical protein
MWANSSTKKVRKVGEWTRVGGWVGIFIVPQHERNSLAQLWPSYICLNMRERKRKERRKTKAKELVFFRVCNEKDDLYRFLGIGIFQWVFQWKKKTMCVDLIK